MDIISFTDNLDSVMIKQILKVWEESVLCTHDFLTEQDIESLKPHVEQALPNLDVLSVVIDNDKSVWAFLGIKTQKIEMLFVHPEIMRQGWGKKLVLQAIEKYKIKFVDVNEQNKEATAFYKHLAFKIFERSEKDALGNDFPILHLRI